MCGAEVSTKSQLFIVARILEVKFDRRVCSCPPRLPDAYSVGYQA